MVKLKNQNLLTDILKKEKMKDESFRLSKWFTSLIYSRSSIFELFLDEYCSLKKKFWYKIKQAM
jgi:hypothetical protein